MEEQKSYLLITRYLSKQTNTEENELLADWIAASPDNEVIFEEIKTVWLASSGRKEDVGAEGALLKLRERIRAEDQPVRLNTRRKFYGIAASVAGLLLISTLLLKFYAPNEKKVQYVQLSTKAGEKKIVFLEDGTKVHLAPQSRLKYPKKFEEGIRTVDLQGEAYFEVSKNPHRPFTVHTSLLEVKVLGTHFNVNSYQRNKSTRVSLFEGKVSVSLSGNEEDNYIIKPGQEFYVNRLTRQIYQRNMDPGAVTGWMTNSLVFKNEKLSDAAEKINLMYGVQIIFSDQNTADTRLYATFENETLLNILETIKATGNINYTIEDKKVYLNLKE